MSFFRRLVDKDDHNKFENCACILIKKDNQGYYFYLIHDGGETNTKRITNIKILDYLDPPPRIQPDELPPNYIIGINIIPKNNNGLIECFRTYTNLLIVRHGKGWHNRHWFLKLFGRKDVDPLYYWRWNSPLIKDGINQSKAAGNAINRVFTAQEYDIFASVLRRTAETAFYFMKAFMNTVTTAFFSKHPIYIIPCNDEVDDKSPDEDCNKSYSQLNVCNEIEPKGKCQKNENRIGKESDEYRLPNVLKTEGLIEDIHYYVHSKILDGPCDESVFKYLKTWKSEAPTLIMRDIEESRATRATKAAAGRQGGSLNKNKKKRRKTLRRKSKRFTKRRTNKRRTNKRRTNKKKRLTKRR